MLVKRPHSAITLLCAALVAGPAWAGLQVLDARTLPTRMQGGQQVDELSDLAWDADEQRLWAVSDRGWLLSFALVLRRDRIARLDPLSTHRLSGDGSKGSARNAEGLVLRHGANGRSGDTELVVAFEAPPRLQRFTLQGRAGAALALPPALTQGASAPRRGLESLAWHPRHGFLTGRESPPQPSHLHTVHALGGANWSFRMPADGPTRMKALVVEPDGRLLVLERLGSAPMHRTLLRQFDPNRCGGPQLCDAQLLGEVPGAYAGLNFEGLARVGPGRYLLVSDNGGDATAPTVFVLVAIDGQPAAPRP